MRICRHFLVALCILFAVGLRAEDKDFELASDDCSNKHDTSGQNVLYGDGHIDGFAVLNDAQLSAGAHHTRHAELFSNGAPKNNLAVLQAIDKVQATAMDGGGYFVGVK